MATLQDIIDAQRDVVGGGGGLAPAVPPLFEQNRPIQQVPPGTIEGFTPEGPKPFTTIPGLFYPEGIQPFVEVGFGTGPTVAEQEAELASAMLFAERTGVSLATAVATLGLDVTTRKALGLFPSSGGAAAGSAPPLWRPGELELLLKEFGLDVDQFEEDRRQFELQFGLSEDSLGLSERTLGETIRSNKALEADRLRGHGLDAASTALSAYLRASEAADARKQGVLSTLPSLLPSLVDPNQEFFAGFEPGGILATAAKRFGLGDVEGVPIQHVALNIGEFIRDNPEQANIRKELIDLILNLGQTGQNAASAEATAINTDATTVFPIGSDEKAAFDARNRAILAGGG